MAKWICNVKDIDLPFTVETEMEAREFLINYNKNFLEDDGTVSKTFTDEFDLGNGNTITVTKILLTTESFDEDDPLGYAYEDNFGSQIIEYSKEYYNVCPSVIECFNPLFSDDEIYGVFHGLRCNAAKDSICVLKNVPNKDIEIKKQKDVYDWIFDNIQQKEYDITNVQSSNLVLFLQTIFSTHSNAIAKSTRRGPATAVIVGDDILDIIENSITIPTDNSSNKIYNCNDFEYLGNFASIPVYKDLTGDFPKDCFVMAHSQNIGKSVFLLKEKEKYYLNTIQHYANYDNDYKQFFQSVKIV